MSEYAFKMFNKDLSCTLGRGKYQYAPGVWYEEKEANCRQNGFHAAKNPLDCLSYYPDFQKSQCWVVEIAGEINEDGDDSKVAVQKIRLVKRLDLPEFVAQACMYVIEHPMLKYNSKISSEKGTAGDNGFVIVAGNEPMAKGDRIGDVVGIIRTDPESRQILEATCFVIDGRDYMPGRWYAADGHTVDALESSESRLA